MAGTGNIYGSYVDESEKSSRDKSNEDVYYEDDLEKLKERGTY